MVILECKKDSEKLRLDWLQINQEYVLITILKEKDDENQITISAHIDILGSMAKEITCDEK